VTLSDLERCNSFALRYFTDFDFVPTHNRVDLWRNLCTSLLYFVVRVYDVVVKKVHVRYLIFWWVSCTHYLVQHYILRQPRTVFVHRCPY